MPLFVFSLSVFNVGVLLMGDIAGIAVRAQINTPFQLICSRISLQNAHFTMYTETSIRQEDSQGKFSTKMFQNDRFHCHKFSSLS